MDKDFSELIEYLDKKFVKIDDDFVELKEDVSILKNKVERIEDRVERIEDRVERIEDRVERIEDRVERIESTMATKEDFDNILTAVDAYAKKADTYFQEMVMLAHKVDRHEKWFHQIANKFGIRLEY